MTEDVSSTRPTGRAKRPYPILARESTHADRASLCALAVMAKAPRAGKVKTRLSPPLTLEESAALNICFLRDTTQNIAEVSAEGGAKGLVCYTPVGDEIAFDDLLPDGFALIPQRGEAFGERLLAAAKDILACGFSSVCLIDSDSPTLPAGALKQAVHELSLSGDRVVIGPSEDGGYYLIGLKIAHPEPFERIPWSTETVYEQTVERVSDAGIELVVLPTWYDVDDAATLAVLEDELLDGKPPRFANVDGYRANFTQVYLAERRHASNTDSSETFTPSSGATR